MASNTGKDQDPKPKKKGTFAKGYDPRRNLRGVPKETIKGRAMIRKIGAELIRIQERQETGAILEYDITRASAMIRLMFSSQHPADKQTLLKALWPGLIKDEVDHTTAGAPITFIIEERDEPPDPGPLDEPPAPDPDPDEGPADGTPDTTIP